MPKTLANTLLIFVLLVIAVLSWQWFDTDPTVKTAGQETIQMAQNKTDYYLEDFNITNVSNDKGQVYKLSGTTLSHYSEKGNSIIESPSVQVYSNEQDYWTGHADAGNLSADFSVLVLQGNVDLSHHTNSQQPKIELDAQSITIDTSKRQMTSDQPVQITAENWSFTANQMSTDVDNGMLSFESGVEANYAVDN